MFTYYIQHMFLFVCLSFLISMIIVIVNYLSQIIKDSEEALNVIVFSWIIIFFILYFIEQKQGSELQKKSEQICSYLSLDKDSCSIDFNFKKDTDDEVIQVSIKVSKKEKCSNEVFSLKQGALTDTGYKCNKTLTIILLEDRKIDEIRLFDKSQIDEIISSKKDIIKEKYLEYFNLK